jgi:hypothetical protein
MLPSVKIQNGGLIQESGLIQDGGENVFFILIFQNDNFSKKLLCCIILLKIQLLRMHLFFEKFKMADKSKWRILFTKFLICSNFFFLNLLCPFFLFYLNTLLKNKTNVAKHEIWRPYSRWTSKLPF